MPRAAAVMRRVIAALVAVGSAQCALAASLTERLAPCLACHGANGQSVTANVPSLGGQPSAYLLVQLFLFREKLRSFDVMNQMARDFSDDDLRAVSETLARLPKPPVPADAGEPGRIQRAQALIQKNHCNSCHNPDLSGRDNIPRLADQREDYLVKALREFKNNSRPGYDGSMAEVLQPVSDAEILDLAYAIARQR